MFSRFLLFFGAAGGGLCAAATGRRGFGARFPAKPCSSVSLAPNPGAFSANVRREFGARFPAKPCSFVDGHHVFGTKGAAGEPDVVLHPPQTLALSSTGTTSLGPKALGRRGFGARFPAKPCSFVSLAPIPGAFSANGRFHPIKTPSRKRRVLIFSCYSLPRPLPRPATRRSTSVSFISSDTIMPSISSSFSTSSSGKRFRIRWQTMLM